MQGFVYKGSAPCLIKAVIKGVSIALFSSICNFIEISIKLKSKIRLAFFRHQFSYKLHWLTAPCLRSPYTTRRTHRLFKFITPHCLALL
jgi:hypothetical protein